LLQCALSNQEPTPDEGEQVGTAAYHGPVAAPLAADMASLFPQLEILELIGQGGMGAVYKARQTKLDRLVAVKILPAEWGQDPAFAERFAREARALARLSHSHIVAVHDFGEAGGLFYLVMEFVDGANLRQVLRGGRLQPQQALAIIPQVCEALQYAHEQGVVHRDIKPENILLDRRGQVKIADFGLAKLMRPSAAEFTLTGSRQVMGTLDYMAPEQRTAPQEVDQRADIYSLGVVFYEMLTGALPLGRFAPPSDKVGVDGRLDEVVFRALEREPARRYQRISEVKTAVESIARATPAAAVAARFPWPVPEDVRARLIQHRLKMPATGLAFTGVVFFLQAAVLAMAYSHELEKFAMNQLGGGWMFLAAIAMGVVALTATMIGGAVKMLRLENHGLVMAAIILAMLPFSYHFLIGFPIGLWALWELRRPEVEAAFALKLQPSLRAMPRTGFSAAPIEGRQAAGWLYSRVRSAWGAMLTLIVHRPTAASTPAMTAASQYAPEQESASNAANALEMRPGGTTPVRQARRTDPEVIPDSGGLRRDRSWIKFPTRVFLVFGLVLIGGFVLLSLIMLASNTDTGKRFQDPGFIGVQKQDKFKVKNLYPGRPPLWFHRGKQDLGITAEQQRLIDAILRFADEDYLILESMHTNYKSMSNTRCVAMVGPFLEERKKLEERVWSQLETALGRQQVDEIRPLLAPGGSLFPYGKERVRIDIEYDAATSEWRFTKLADSGLGESSHGSMLPQEYARFWNH
jgi:tRNA A-37 threonylcarbamoyl transferase component Bud32